MWYLVGNPEDRFSQNEAQLTRLGKKRAGFSAIENSYFCCFCLKEYLLLWVIGKGCDILLWHSMDLPYNYSVMIDDAPLRFNCVISVCNAVSQMKHVLTPSSQLLIVPMR